MKHSSSSGCMSLWQIFILPRLIWFSKLFIMLETWVFVFGSNGIVPTARGLDMQSQALSNILILVQGRLVNTEVAMDMSLWLIVYISKACLVSKNWSSLCLIVDSSFGRKDTVMTGRGSDKLSEAHPISLIHLQEVWRHSSSNQCLSLWHIITFPRLALCQETGYLV